MSYDKQARKNAGHPNTEDFSEWEDRARSMTDRELWAARLDCNQAMRAMRQEPISGWYSDEACTYAQELNRRRKSA